MTIATPRLRIPAIDALRGLVMIIMALDHVRDFFHAGAMSQSPTDLSTTTPMLFFTRWVTHFCAPVFVFLAGMSASLWLSRAERTKAQLSRFLWTRGLWLVFVEVSVMRVALDFSFDRGFPVLLLILWALGGSMIALAALVHLPVRILAILSGAVILLHNCLDGVRAEQFGSLSWVWNLIHQPGAIMTAGPVIVVGYPLIPWIAVMAMGFCFGQMVRIDPLGWQRVALWTGLGLMVGFVVIRALNVYGDPVPWAVQKSVVFTVLSFLNCTKYPASLDFLLMTLGPALVALVWLNRVRIRADHPFLVFGGVPFFYYLVHFYWAHLLAVLMAALRFGQESKTFLLRALPSMGGPKELFPADFGYNLWVVYLVWAFVIMTMYPACRWFVGVKDRRRDWWLSYL